MRLFQSALATGVLLIMPPLTAVDAPAQETSADLTIVNPAGLYDPAPNGFSHAVVAENVSHIAFIAGQSGEDENGTFSPRFADQVRNAYDNLLTALDAVGAEPRQVTRITTYVVDYGQSMLALMTEGLQRAFGGWLPAQTLVPVPRLALDGMLFEVDAIAILGAGDASG